MEPSNQSQRVNAQNNDNTNRVQRQQGAPSRTSPLQGRNITQINANSIENNNNDPQPNTNSQISNAERGSEIAQQTFQESHTPPNLASLNISDETAIKLSDEMEKEALLQPIYYTPKEFTKLLNSGDSFPTNPIVVKGSLYLRDCENLITLPAILRVEGNLYLTACSNLTTLPANLQVGEDLYLYRCPSLTTLPADLQLGGYLHIQDCSNVTTLPANLRVKGNLKLFGCPSLTVLPGNLQVGGNLQIFRCPSLTALPADLQVGGNLRLRNFSNATRLPDNLQVGNDLCLLDCTSLSTLPANPRVGGNLNLRGCTSLTALPNWITTLGPRENGEVRDVDLSNTGLSDAVIARLREADAPGMRFYFGHQAAEQSQTFKTVEDGLKFWASLTKDEEIPEVRIDQFKAEVCTFLGRLVETAEYKNKESRPLLAQRVIDLFKLMNEDEELKGIVVNSMYNGLTSCDDRIISALDEIDLMVQIYMIEKGDHGEDELKELAKGFFLLEKVNQKAVEHIKSLTFVDEIEVYLAFQIALSERFNLPIQTKNMIFRGCAQIKSDQLEQIGNEIEKAYSEKEFNVFLESWSPWQAFKRRQTVLAYENLPNHPNRKLQDDDICIFTQEVPEDPVFYENGVYGFKSLKKWIDENGTNPMLTSEKIDLSKLYRLEKE